MGFIDWHGTKEDHYEDMVEFAQMKQHEEQRLIAEEKAAKWLKETIGSSAYTKMNIPDLMKQILLSYKSLLGVKESIIGTGRDLSIDTNLLWRDFCTGIMIGHMDFCKVPLEKRETFYNTFMTKVFKLEDYTPYGKHVDVIKSNNDYRNYFADCFDITKEKQFWKCIGHCGQNDRNRLSDFVKVYERLSIILGYYLFQEIEPDGDEWMKALSAEKQVLDRVAEEYLRGRYKEPNFEKLRNPLYVTDSFGNNFKLFGDMKKELAADADNGARADAVAIERKHQVDKERLTALIEQQNMDAYIEACGLLRNACLPEEMDESYVKLTQRLLILKESMDRYKDHYEPDMYSFYDFYIPEALQITASYTEYLDVGIGEKILLETEHEVMEAIEKLIIAVNEKIDEIYRFASIEIKAKAKALDSVMGQNGYVAPEFKINNMED